MTKNEAKKAPVISVACLSAGALAYEILLMRLFSIIQWHHFAYMIISLALLGYGMSGTIVSLAQHWLMPRYRSIFIALVALFGAACFGCFALAQRIPFNAEEILWTPIQLFYLLGLFLLLSIPFCFASAAICLTFRCNRTQAALIYGADLIGAGIGSAGILLLLYAVFPQTALGVISSFALFSGVAAVYEHNFLKKKTLAAIFLIAGSVAAVFSSRFELILSPYKELSQALRIGGTRIVAEYSSPLGLISAVESDRVPLRHAPGLSLSNTIEPLAQVALFTDGGNMSVVTKKAESLSRLAYLDQMSSALAYHLGDMKKVLILGAGGGSDILQAKFHGVKYIDAVELNPQIPDLIQQRYAEFSGDIFKTSANLHIEDIRGFVKSAETGYSLIQMTMGEGFSSSASGVYALNENYLYTVEAFMDYMKRLDSGGYLAVTRWIKIPPRDAIKLFATALAGLKRMGVEAPEKRLVLIRSWQTSTLLVKKGDFSTAELYSVEKFCEQRSFDISYSPALTRGDVNRHNVLRLPYFYIAAKELTGESPQKIIHRYKFNITPATDDRPYFYHFFKWASLAEILRLREWGAAPFLESGYLVLTATLAIALIVSVVLILSPLSLMKRRKKMVSKVRERNVFFFFSSVGLSFLFMEIAFLQKLILVLHHPVFSVSVGLATFLIFAGLGSLLVQKYSSPVIAGKIMKTAALIIAVYCFLYIFLLSNLLSFLASSSLMFKISASVVITAPLPLFMGMFFPLALHQLAGLAQHLIPWAWGVNGCASVVGASLATLLAIQFGFSMLILFSVILYIFAAWLFTCFECN